MAAHSEKEAAPGREPEALLAGWGGELSPESRAAVLSNLALLAEHERVVRAALQDRAS